MKLDRAQQLAILNLLADKYPDERHDIFIHGEPAEDEEKKIANMLYLEEHGLINSGLTRGSQNKFQTRGALITAAGIDFLADDGGLSAILGVVTIKLHDETIRNLVATRIQESNLPAEQKAGLLDQLRELRGESLKHLTMKLLDAGVESMPTLLQAIQNLM